MKSFHNIARQLGALFFLGAFLFTFFPQGVHFSHDHDHEEHAHGAEEHQAHDCEILDPCHLVVFHESSESCGHDAHFHETMEQCELCSKLLQETNQFVRNLTTDQKATVFAELSYPNYADVFVSQRVDLKSVRGPPVSATC